MHTSGNLKRRRFVCIQSIPVECSSEKVPPQIQLEPENKKGVENIDDNEFKNEDKLSIKKRRVDDGNSVITSSTLLTEKLDHKGHWDHVAKNSPCTKDTEFLLADEEKMNFVAELSVMVTTPATTFQSEVQSKRHIITPETSFLELCSHDLQDVDCNVNLSVSTVEPLRDPVETNSLNPYHTKNALMEIAEQDINIDNGPTVQKSFQGKSCKWWKVILFFFCSFIIFKNLTPSQPFEKDCLYLSGGGFSGFWYLLGQLQKRRRNDEDIDYLCYSAGCLISAAVIVNCTFEELYESAVSIQIQWKSGSLSRFDVVEAFVDDIFGKNSSCSSNFTFDQSSFSKIHVLTSVPSITGLMETHVSTPIDLKHLKSLLVQSAWIPFVTGNYFWHPSGHIDGGFSMLQHPKCRSSISFPWDYGIILNTLNINVAKEEAERFWKMGLSY